MKRIALVSVLCVLVGLSSMAQDKGFYYGSRLGLGESTFEGGGLSDINGKLFWQLGGASAYQFHKYVGLTADFLVTGRGSKGSGISEDRGLTGTREYKYEDNISILSVDVPLAAKLSYGRDNFFFKVYAGYSLNFHLGGTYSRTYEDSGFNNNNGFQNKSLDNLETMDQGLVYGFGIDIKANDGRIFFLDFRKSDGQERVAALNNANLFQNYFSLQAGYLFH